MRQRLAQFSVGAAGYSTLEVLARGHTHWTMAVLGGICLCALCAIAHSFAHKSIVFRRRWAPPLSLRRNLPPALW